MRPLQSADLVRGQYVGYRDEKGVASDSDIETFCALRLFIDSWRWAGVPWYIRAGKRLPRSVVEVQVQMQPPPQRLFDDSGPAGGRANYVRFRLQPQASIALAARTKRPGKELVGVQRELYLGEEEPSAMSTYERLLGDAMTGDDALFTDEDAVMAAWAVVEPVLADHGAALPYAPDSWGPTEAAELIAGDGGWHDPAADAPPSNPPKVRGA
jgi:glucose-6-phosphate 1-dehydrogenase